MAEACKAAATTPGCRVEVTQVDVTQEDSVQKATDYMVEAFGRIDYCVNCAGVGLQVYGSANNKQFCLLFEQVGVEQPREVSEADIDEFNRFYRVHVNGTLLLTRSVSAAMKCQEPKAVGSASSGRGASRGSIVILGSGSSYVPQPAMVQYTAAKHAVLGIVKNAGKPALISRYIPAYMPACLFFALDFPTAY